MKTQDKNSEGSTLIIFMWLAIAIVLIVVIMAVIENKNQVKEPPAKPWINPDGSLPYETVKALAPDYIKGASSTKCPHSHHYRRRTLVKAFNIYLHNYKIFAIFVYRK